jgi:hypothetical protein
LDQRTIIESLQTAPVLLSAFAAHERRRAYAALRQGDPFTLIRQGDPFTLISFAREVFAMAIFPVSFLRDPLMHPVPTFALGVQ